LPEWHLFRSVALVPTVYLRMVLRSHPERNRARLYGFPISFRSGRLGLLGGEQLMNRFVLTVVLTLCTLLSPFSVRVAPPTAKAISHTVAQITASFPWSQSQTRSRGGECRSCSEQCSTVRNQCLSACGELPAPGTDPTYFGRVSRCRNQCRHTWSDCTDACDNPPAQEASDQPVLRPPPGTTIAN